MNLDVQIKIKLKDGKELNLDLNDAKELFNELYGLFGKDESGAGNPD